MQIIRFLCLYTLAFSVLTPPVSAEQNQFGLHIFEVRPGDSLISITPRLKAEGIISSELWFRILIKAKGSPQIKRGIYEFPPNSSASAVLKKLISGQTQDTSVTFPEGYNHYEMYYLLYRKSWPQAQDFLNAVRDPNLIASVFPNQMRSEHTSLPPSLEGYLFPDTYTLDNYTGGRELIQKMVDQFTSNYRRIREVPPLPLTPHQIVTLASIIEKETGNPSERNLIASVFYNRIHKGMKLQTDPHSTLCHVFTKRLSY